MAPTSRSRQSGPVLARHAVEVPNGPPSSSASRPHNLPAYEKPIAVLNAESQQKLEALLKSNKTIERLQKHLAEAAKLIIDSGGEIGDKLRERNAYLRTRRGKRERATNDGRQNLDNDTEIRAQEESLQVMEDKVERMTKRMDATLRKTIDGFNGVENLDQAIKELSRTSATARQERSEHQSEPWSQQQDVQQSISEGIADNTEGNEFMASQANVTQITNSTQPPQPPAAATPALQPLFSETLERLHDQYTALSLSARYADHPDYASFKKVTHDAKYGDDGPSVPHKNSWFASEEGRRAPAPGVTGSRAAANAADVEKMDESDDSDIAIARIRISTRCPLTLLEFKDPVTSRACNHSYERSAIMDMIRGQRPPTRARNVPLPEGWVPAVQCPVAGCDMQVTQAVLEHDAVLVRRIKRIQRARQMSGPESDGEDTERAEVINSDSGDDVDQVCRMSTARSIKHERMKSQTAARDEIEDD